MSMRRPTEARVVPNSEALEKAQKYMKNMPHNAVNIIATMAHHAKFSRAFRGLTRFVLEEATVPRRQRELVILRMGWNCQAEYEFGQHTLMAKANGVTDAEVHSVTRPLSTHDWSDEDGALLQMVDDLYQDDCISNESWERLGVFWKPPEVIEFVASALTYRMVSGFLNSFGVELDEGVPRWPS
jgi:alkylhydroperoxidase/carboxymuconolactone decarboxylase family protein YurZ